MYAYTNRRSRALSATGAVVLPGLIILALARGLRVDIAPMERRGMPLLDFAMDPPPPEVEPERKAERAPREEGAAAPPNLVSRATEIAAPPPVLPAPPTMPVAETPAQGNEATSGAAPVAGPGTGAGGEGDGSGSGRFGDGRGGGGDTPLRLRSGRITNRDYPKAALDVNAQGTVYLRFTVGVNGRVTDCTVTQSSGNAALDETTCRLIRQRFRYTPSKDARGKPYADTVIGEQVWKLWERSPE
ncbi:energy transducer TonB [Sphingomonas soli]|uniref:energy transducer TonB n=1 Tax=Sphingomonas soli TaxID=266127 RepID=UPI000A40439E|nr:energy transducer TonB [Sphingomonas soli]